MTSGTRLKRPERRAVLLQSATKLFAQKGFQSTEVQEIVEKAGVTKPMLYRHFPGGKEEIFQAVLDNHIEKLLKELWSAMASASDPRERIRQGLKAYLLFSEQNPEAFRMLTNTAQMDNAAGERLREARSVIVKGLANTIGDVMKAAGLPAGGAPVYAYALLGGAESVIDWWLTDQSLDRETFVDYILAFVWRGFDGLPKDPSKFHLATNPGQDGGAQ